MAKVQKRAARRPGGGSVRLLSSGKWQARRPHPTDVVVVPTTGQVRPRMVARSFAAKVDAEGWLWMTAADAFPVAVETHSSTSADPTSADPTLEVYANAWLNGREIKPRTHAHYRRLLDQQILPALGARHLSAITPAVVRAWYAEQDRDKPTLRAHAYALLRTVLTSAADEDILATNPCRIRGAGASKRARGIEPATLPQLEVIVAAMPEAYRLLVLFAAWCALRVGEVTELRRKDVDVEAGVIHVRRGVVWVDGANVVGDPKSEAGARDVNIPPHLLPLVTTHLAKHTAKSGDSLLFPGRSGGHLPPSTLRGMWTTARTAADRPDLRFHDLRHTGAVLAAATGATLAELMARLGHTTPGAAMRYQHAAADRDKVIAAALSAMVAERT